MRRKLSDQELQQAFSELPQWHTELIAEAQSITRSYTFKNFMAALTFANRIGELAEAANHHPQLNVQWGRVDVFWWSHDVEGITTSDVELAHASDALFNTL
ncbi:4a-hydroxytetrahydrobiopterin dehydratase [Thalassolituus sp.]|uniref:4a-hydroxytetrahydrobiopterin dehydratase n=1 Tax=Thalassolituus sp. TaxID=2030822 RepID=UPI002A8118A9|nr:4a-hydroxytetrahydrobiopterin dehydratase [Thalassolituus sp.]|tara:strand:+ start:723 stop:1025 length:303 start_codon:yes stop_codon:yes gene_type:complete